MTRSGQLDPTTAQHIELATSVGAIAALRTGPADGADVLLLPGFTGSKEDFTPLLDPLGEEGFRVTAIDLPGQFESPGPDDPAAYAPDALAAVVHEIGAQFDGPVHLVGHSFGGLVARAAALADASRWADLVLMSSGPSALAGARRRRLDDLEPLLPLGLSAVYDAMEAALAADPSYVPPPPDLAAFLRRRFLAGNIAMLAGMADVLRSERDRVDALARVDLDILVLFGADDDAWPPAVQAEMAERLAAQVMIIDGAAHSPAVENTSATADALVKFWRS